MTQTAYIKSVIKRFNLDGCSAQDAHVSKGDKLHRSQCPKNQVERNQMDRIPCVAAVGSLMYAQTCTRPDISFAVGVLSRYQSKPGMEHWRAAEKAIQYLKGITNCMLTYKRSNKLDVIGYSNADFAGCLDTSKSTSGYAFMLAGEQYHGEVLNKHLLLHQLFMLNSWRALKPRGGHHS